MSFKHIVFEAAEDGISLVKVTRPEKLNAINSETMTELGEVFDRASADPNIKALIVTGEGEKAFVAGADIQELAHKTALQMQQLSRFGQSVFGKLESMGKPTIAAINGFALGAGLELAMACHLRIATPNAKLGLPETKLGLIPGYGGTQRLPRLVGLGRALEILLSSEPISTQEAHHIGLLNRVVESTNLLPTARELLSKILANGPIATRLATEIAYRGVSVSLEVGLELEAAGFGLAASTEDRAEGTRAFLE
ncbi:MAG TPA: enoyl-CoA hydratase-related protein, partial [Bryobacteraceae bacterium]|nr:enoyl-CoA hydratase-related protein [Bryobacteraceae bacterium]